jgi:hypothetical protein
MPLRDQFRPPVSKLSSVVVLSIVLVAALAAAKDLSLARARAPAAAPASARTDARPARSNPRDDSSLKFSAANQRTFDSAQRTNLDENHRQDDRPIILAGRIGRGTIGPSQGSIQFFSDGTCVFRGQIQGDAMWHNHGRAFFMESPTSFYDGKVIDNRIYGIRTFKATKETQPWSIDFSVDAAELQPRRGALRFGPD